MKNVVYLALWGYLKLIFNCPYFPLHHVHPKEARFEFFRAILLYGCLPIRLESQINKVPYLKSTLHSVFIFLYFLLILCPVQMILEFSKYILAHLDPILYHGCSIVPEYNIHKSERIIIV